MRMTTCTRVEDSDVTSRFFFAWSRRTTAKRSSNSRWLEKNRNNANEHKTNVVENQVGAETTLALSGLTEKQRHSTTLIRYLLNFYCSQKWI